MKPFTFFALSLFALSLQGDDLSFGQMEAKSSSAPSSQALQIHSSKSLDAAKESLKKVPAFHKKHVKIYQSGEFYATRYLNPDNPKILPWIVRDFKKAGFTDAYVMLPNTFTSIVDSSHTSSKSTQTTLSKPQNLSAPAQNTLKPHDRSRLIWDAQSAFNRHDFSQATIYYEMLTAAGAKDRQILINLAYLYGKEGSIGMLERQIEGKRSINDYLYAYGVGALESGRHDLYTSLSPHLAYDTSGKLSLICGYFFEKENLPQRAESFYKMAYDANPSDPYILYAYARNSEMRQDYPKARSLYTQLSQFSDQFEDLKSLSNQRLSYLRSIQP